MKNTVLFVLLMCYFVIVKAQVGGTQSFDFLNLNSNARISAIGGDNVSSSGWDPNTFLTNPATLNPEQHQRVSVSYLPFQQGIKKGDITYVLPCKSFEGIGLGVQFLNYGTFTETNQAGETIGEFNASEYAITGGVAHTQGNFAVGANLKFLGSQISSYTAYAIASDIGVLFNHPEKEFQVGLSFRNVGFMMKKYTEITNKATPFDIQLGWSYKLEHMPLRFSMTAHHLNRWDVQYLDPNRDFTLDDGGNEIPKDKSFGQKLFRHFTFGGEFMLTDGFHLRAGYNFMRRQEMKVEARRGMTGFTFGAMVRMGWVEFNYSRILYHVVGGTNNITLTLDTSKLLKRKEVAVTEI